MAGVRRLLGWVFLKVIGWCDGRMGGWRFVKGLGRMDCYGFWENQVFQHSHDKAID